MHSNLLNLGVAIEALEPIHDETVRAEAPRTIVAVSSLGQTRLTRRSTDSARMRLLINAKATRRKPALRARLHEPVETSQSRNLVLAFSGARTCPKTTRDTSLRCL